MSTDSWVVSLTAVAATGNVTQLYPAYAPAGVAKATAVPGDDIRTPVAGCLHTMQVETDGTNGGLLQIYDMSGDDAGADVSSASVITNAQLAAQIARGKAKLIFEKTFTSAIGAETASFGSSRKFSRGLAARFSNAGPTGTCKLNMTVEGGVKYNETAGL
jgi:hypothetical protein